MSVIVAKFAIDVISWTFTIAAWVFHQMLL